MATSAEQPWASGPTEIFEHAVELLQRDSDISRRIALILIDNAVEQTMKTYLDLPRRVTGISIPRKRREEIESFPMLLDAFEEFASDKLEGVDLGMIEWYHGIRNKLYHQGHGLTVETSKVEIYAQLANTLLSNVFGESVVAGLGPASQTLGEFMDLWIQLENVLMILASKHGSETYRGVTQALQWLIDADVLVETDVSAITRLRRIRNDVVHAQVDYRETVTAELIAEIKQLVARLAAQC